VEFSKTGSGVLNLKPNPPADDIINVQVENANADKCIVIEDVRLLDETDNPILTLTINAIPDPIFLWSSATIDKTFPEGNSKSFNIADLTDTLEDTLSMENIDFDDIGLYLYTDAPDTLIKNTSLKVTAWGTAKGASISSNIGDLTGAGGPIPLQNPGVPSPTLKEGESYTGTLPAPQLIYEDKPPQLAGVFNAKPPDLRLDMEIEVTPKALTENTKMKADILIKLPFKLKVKSATGDPPGYEYGKVSLLGLLPDDPNEDLLGRENADDDMNEYIDMARAITMVIDYENTIGLDNFTVNIVAGQGDTKRTISTTEPLKSGKGAMGVEMRKEDLARPFRPLVEILVPLESGKDYGILEVKRAVVKDGFWGFQAKARVTVQAEIDKEFSF
jgi:hypothetical protein